MQQSGKGMVRRLAVVLGSAALLLPLAEPVGQHAGTVARHLLAVAVMVVATPAQAQDSTPPRVISIERRTPATSPTNANTLTWRVTFSEFVATPGTTDFMVSGSTAEVTNVTKLGGFSTNTTDPTSYSVTVSGGNLATFNGTVTLGFATSQAIIDFFGNRLTDTTPTVTNESNYVVDNTAPSVTYTAPTSLTVGMAIMLTPSTTDSDASSHSYSATGLPAGLEIDASAGVISGAPTAVSTATSEVVVTVTDSVGNSATVSFIFPAVEVPPNTAPTVANEIEDQTATVGTAFSFQFPAATFEDVDGDMLTYTATLDDDTTLPSWLRFDTANRSFSGTPGAGDGGTLTVRVTAGDGTDLVHDDFEIKVATVCAAPNFGTRRQIWTGTVTVGTWGNGVVVSSHGYLDTSIISDPNDIGALDDNDFAIAGRTYIINRVDVWRSDGPPAEGDLRFSLTSSLMDREKAALRLHVCDTAYDFDDASNSSSRPNDYDWSLELDWSGESTRTLHLSLPENNAATGLPTITSSDGATVGDVLTANQVTIADTDGLPASFPNDYTFQWVREDEDGMNPEDITGETSSTYTLRTDDVGKKVRVRVSFTDQLSGMETVTSDAFPTSDTVAAPDTTPPQVTLITRSDSGTSPTNEDSLTWRVRFSEAVNNVDTGTFMVSSTPPMATPPTVTSVEAVVGETGVYDVTVSGGDLATFDGTVILALASGSDPPDLINPLTPIQPGITDEAGNPLDRNILPGTSESYVVDHTAPMVTAITRQTPTTSPTNANSLTWRVTFSEVVTNVDGGDFTVGSTPPMATPPTVSNVEAVSGETGVHDVTVSGGDLATFDGTVTLDFASGQDIQDHAGNPLATTTLTGNYVVDNTAPTLTYTAPMFLIVGTAITPVEPSTTDTDIASTSATDLPAGLMIDASTGVISGTPDTANASPSEVVVTVTDNTGNSATVALTFPAVVQPGVSVAPPRLSPVEGETATYTLVLDTLPAGPVIITPTRSGDSGGVSVSLASVTFTAANWNTAQVVSVTAMDDDNTASETVTISHSISGYGAVTSGDAVVVTVTDDDTPGVSVQRPVVSTDEGEMAAYTMRLVTQPAGPVTISPTSGDSGAVSLTPARLTFTVANWNTPRTVSVTGVQDDDASNETVTVSHSVSGYGAITTAPAVMVTVTDGDTAQVSVSPVSVNTDEGGTATYTLALDTLPNGPVTITPTNGDSGAVSVSPARLTFTPSNWDMPRTISVTGLQDDDANDETVSISHNVSGYGGVSVGAGVTVSVTDDDTARVRVTPISLSADEGGTATYTLQLSTKPAGAVTITPTSGDSGAVSLSPATLTITPSTWDTPRSVAVTAGQDDDGTDETVSVGHRVSGYGAVTSADAVTVTVTDDDTARVRVTPTSLSFSEGGTVTYTLQLSTKPAGAVTITPTSGDSGAVSVSPATLTFTPSTWDTPRSVAVTAGQDDDGTDETVSVGHRVSGYGAVTSADAVTVTVTDNTADTTAPMVTAIERQTPATSPTNADSLTWRVTFSKAVTNMDATAFMVSGSTATVTSVQVVQGETLAHDVTVSGGDLADLNGTVTLSFAPGQDIADAAGNGLTDTTPTGTNHNSYLVDNTSMETAEPLAAAWLARMGRSVAQQVMDAVAKRGQDDPAPGLQLSVAGESLNTELELSSLAGNHGLLAKVLGFEGVTRQQLAEGTGFALSPAGAPGGVSLWGEAALSGFATTDHDLSLEADLFTTLLGSDWRSGQWRVGAALAHSTGSGTYHANPGVAHGAGEVSSRVTGFYPYVHYAVTPQFSLWGVVGSGRGEWSLTPDGGRQQDMPLTLSLAAVGMEGLLRDGGSQGFTLKSRMDALWMGGSADAADAADAEGDGEDVLEVDDVAAEVSRVRLGLQASRSFPMGDGALFTPSLEVGLRQDGGDADTGFGLDMGAGLRWHHHRHGLSAQLQGRRLLVHMAEDFSDQGLSLALSWDPTPDSTLGPSFSLEQTLGGPATAQVEALLGGSATAASTTTNGGRGNAMDNQRLALRWGYGLSAFRDAFSLTPHLAVGFSPTGRDTTLGWTLAPLGHNSAARSSTVSLEVTRREPTAHHHAAGPRHSLELQLDSRF